MKEKSTHGKTSGANSMGEKCYPVLTCTSLRMNFRSFSVSCCLTLRICFSVGGTFLTVLREFSMSAGNQHFSLFSIFWLKNFFSLSFYLIKTDTTHWCALWLSWSDPKESLSDPAPVSASRCCVLTPVHAGRSFAWPKEALWIPPRNFWCDLTQLPQWPVGAVAGPWNLPEIRKPSVAPCWLVPIPPASTHVCPPTWLWQ